MVDVDSCEACCYCSEPVALIETQASTREPKPAPITGVLARLAGIEAYSVSYEPTLDGRDIVTFQVQRVQPPDPTIQTMLPGVYAYWLLSLRDQHIREAHPDLAEQNTLGPRQAHNWCDCSGHMGFHVDCDENGARCHCQPHLKEAV